MVKKIVKKKYERKGFHFIDKFEFKLLIFKKKNYIKLFYIYGYIFFI